MNREHLQQNIFCENRNFDIFSDDRLNLSSNLEECVMHIVSERSYKFSRNKVGRNVNVQYWIIKNG
nr:hypothetical protein B11C_200063 [Bartonella sp. 1-1C]